MDQPSNVMPCEPYHLSEAGSEAYTLFQRGVSYLDHGHPGQAVEVLRRATRLEPSKPSIRETLARSYYALGLFEEAAREFTGLTSRWPTNDYAWFGAGAALLRLGRYIEARGALRLAVAMAPERPEYCECLARAEDAVHAQGRAD